MTARRPWDEPRRHGFVKLALLFGTIYFVQGLSEPTTGIVSQPDQSLLRSWGESPAQIAAFVALIELPWCFKPLFGLLSDFVPLAGSRRRSYLVVTSLSAAVCFIGLYFSPLAFGAKSNLLVWLLPATIAVVFADVVIDAVMIETGQPLGITGQLQSVQWAAVYAGTVVTGLMGGVLSEYHLVRVGFLLCAAMMAGTFLLSARALPERVPQGRESWSEIVSSLGRAFRSRSTLTVSGLLFLWHFNPFSPAILYYHMRGPAGFGEEFYGDTVSLNALGSLLACVGYGVYCRRVRPRQWVHLAIVAGIASTLVYWRLSSERWAVAVSLAAGFTYMTANMALVDLAARACHIDAAGTLFAVFMAVCNVSTALATWLGGHLYQAAIEQSGAGWAFTLIVGLGGIGTASSWLVVWLLPRDL